jgi:hypothetical protein
MLTLIIALGVMVGVWAGLHIGVGWGGWSITVAVLAGLAVHVGVALLIRRKINAIMTAIQDRLNERGMALRRKYEQMGNRGGNVKWIMDQARRDQDALMNEALASTRAMDAYRRWMPLLDRQINAVRIQFLHALRNFDEVDRLLPKTLLADATLACIKLCRLYKRGQDEALRKAYEKTRKRFKHDAVLIYATYAWMLVKKGKADEAIKVLVDGKRATDDEVLAANWEHLVNGRASHFSNAALGERWYALLLEEPKQPKPQVIRQARPGGKWRRPF